MTHIEEILQGLKAELQREGKAADFERMVAVLLGRLLDVPLIVAASGFQHGADAGPVGRQGRRFRVECKHYGDKTSLDRRSLLGELVQAADRDEALEAWVLTATRPVPAQIQQDLIQHGEKLGIPVFIVDCSDREISALAALCAAAPDIVAEFLSPDAARLAAELQPHAGSAIASLHRELQSWCLGFAMLRERSLTRLGEIWASPRVSLAQFGQDAAGGAVAHKVRRVSVHAGLRDWWAGTPTDAPMAVVGWDGKDLGLARLDGGNGEAASHRIVGSRFRVGGLGAHGIERKEVLGRAPI